MTDKDDTHIAANKGTKEGKLKIFCEKASNKEKSQKTAQTKLTHWNKDSNTQSSTTPKSALTQQEKGQKIIQSPKNKMAARFSEWEITSFTEALNTGRIGQTHFADPGANFCYRCPLCRKK